MTDEKKYWNTAFSDNPEYFDKSDFAEEVISYFPQDARVLDIGCGLGSDSQFFVRNGCSVVGIDFSEVAVEKNKKMFADEPQLSFMQVDIAEPLPFSKAEFDVVYARLSLHYFTDAVTQKIISEISRVLIPNGLFCFECKSTKDLRYGQGEKVAEDMFAYKGHTRHFFSEKYVRKLLKNKFEIVKMNEGDEYQYTRDAGFIKVIAKKI